MSIATNLWAFHLILQFMFEVINLIEMQMSLLKKWINLLSVGLFQQFQQVRKHRK